jgi:hypothetical protein
VSGGAATARTPLVTPETSAETRMLLDQIREHRKDVAARIRTREKKQDQARKIRIAARLVHLVRRGNSEAKKLLDQIFNALRDDDRPLFAGWDLYPSPPPPVPISAQHLPRTLQEIDDEIRRLEEHLEKRLAVEKEDDQQRHPQRMTILGGALLGLVEAGSAEADTMLDTILEKIPRKERKPFDGWERPRLPATAKPSAQPASTSQAGGAAQSAPPAASPDARGKDKKTPAATHAGQPATTSTDGKDETAAAKRGGKGTTSTRTSVTDEGARDAATGPDTEHEPTIPVAIDQGVRDA